MNKSLGNIHPKIEGVYKNLPDTSNISAEEFQQILGINKDKFKRLYLQGLIPKCTYNAVLLNKYNTKKNFWNMKIVRQYVKDFEKYVSGEIQPHGE